MTLCDSLICHQPHVLCGCTTFGTELKLGLGIGSTIWMKVRERCVILSMQIIFCLSNLNCTNDLKNQMQQNLILLKISEVFIARLSAICGLEPLI